MAASIKTRGIIVSEAPMGEQDKRLAILCVDKGRISAIAKGAKKPGGKLASQTQLFYYCDFMMEQSRGFWIIREASVIESFYELRMELEQVAWASWMVETAQMLAVEGEECNDLIRLLLRGLRMLPAPQLSPRMTATAFVLRALAGQGLQPETERCVVCGGPDPAGLSAISGGAVCRQCFHQTADVLPISSGGLYTLRHIFNAQETVLYKFHALEDIQKTLFEFTRRFLHNYTQKELASLEFIQNLLQTDGSN